MFTDAETSPIFYYRAIHFSTEQSKTYDVSPNWNQNETLRGATKI